MTSQDAAAFIMLVGGVYFVTRPLITAFARRIGGGPAEKVDPQLVEELRMDLNETRAEMASLAERLDFAERMLAKQRDAERLPPAR